jgi:hypothetical protein
MNRRLSESASVLDDAHLNTSQIASFTREMFNLEAESTKNFHRSLRPKEIFKK